jgi:hypothetical protein
MPLRGVTYQRKCKGASTLKEAPPFPLLTEWLKRAQVIRVKPCCPNRHRSFLSIDTPRSIDTIVQLRRPYNSGLMATANWFRINAIPLIGNVVTQENPP